MPEHGVAVTCIANARIRILCSLILRHAGYHVVEADSVEAAIAIIDREPVTRLIAGALADPNDQLTAYATSRNVIAVRLNREIENQPIDKVAEIIGLR